jgi:quercetin dioxygenase-like cupin family protein
LVRTSDGETAGVSPGDVVHAPPGELHWHGAAPDSPMMHLSITSGGATVWEGKVDDEEYGAAQ